MKILIDIGHPAHVHLFKNLYRGLLNNGHTVIVTARKREIIVDLLNYYQIPFYSRHSSGKGLLKKSIGFIRILASLFFYCKKNKPDLLIGGVGNAYIAVLSKMIKKTSIILDDTEHSKFEIFFIKHFADVIFTPKSYQSELGIKQIKYRGFHALFYLHPDIYLPNDDVYDKLNINKNTKYIVVRFVSWDASHDLGIKGMSYDDKISLIKTLSSYAKIYISSEKDLESPLNEFSLQLPSYLLHDVLANASLVITEGGSIASEAAILATPTIYINSLSAGVLKELENYGLIHSNQKYSDILVSSINILKNDNAKHIYKTRRDKMINEKIDVNKMLLQFIESYPQSLKTIPEVCNLINNSKY